jgi:DUF4097 and DUF4098 domain-containing protein YvlB
MNVHRRRRTASCHGHRLPPGRALHFFPALFLLPALLMALGPVHAQAQADDWCAAGRSNQEQVCEVRELTAQLRNGAFSINTGPNGSISVEEWDGRDVRILARVAAQARTEGAARDAFEQISLRVGTGSFETEGPRSIRNGGWSVSVRIQVPRGTDLTLSTTNGSIKVEGVSGPVTGRTTNGSITATELRGRVNLRTTNGAIQAHFDGPLPPEGEVRLQTTNGGLDLTLPRDVSARLEASTTNGGISTDFPITVQGRIGRQVSATLGGGGPLIEARTTNGAIRLREG